MHLGNVSVSLAVKDPDGNQMLLDQHVRLAVPRRTDRD